MSDLTFKNLNTSLLSLRSKKFRHVHNSVSILACTLSLKLCSKNTSSPCPNLNVSYLTECEFVAKFCMSDRSEPFWFVQRKLGECWNLNYKVLSAISEKNRYLRFKSLKTGKFSLAQASVKWKFVIDAPDIFGLFLSPSWFCFHACW